MYLVTLVVKVLLPCYYGSRMNETSATLATNMFHSELHVDNQVDRKLIIILMESLKKPIKIPVASVFQVNLETFLTLINFAYSLFTFFSRINRK